jgi:hypothetical protein
VKGKDAEGADWDTDIVVDDVDHIRHKYVPEEHPVIGTELEYIRGYQNEQPGKQGHAADMAQEPRINAESRQNSIKKVTQSRHHRDKLEDDEQKFMTSSWQPFLLCHTCSSLCLP